MDIIIIKSKIAEVEGCFKKNINKDLLITILMITKIPIIRISLIKHKYKILISKIQNKTWIKTNIILYKINKEYLIRAQEHNLDKIKEETIHEEEVSIPILLEVDLIINNKEMFKLHKLNLLNLMTCLKN